MPLLRWQILSYCALCIVVSNAFVANLPNQKTSVIGSPIFAFHDGSEYEDALSRNKARTDLRNFLTQRSIQSFAFLLKQVRDEHTVRWIEKNLGFHNIDGFHGTGAFNMTLFPSWDSLFLELVMRPKESIVIEIKRKQNRRRGLSGKNAYLDNLNGKTQIEAMIGKKERNVEKLGVRRGRTTNVASYLNNLSQEPPKPALENTRSKSNAGTTKSFGGSSYLENLGSTVNKKPDNKKKTNQSSKPVASASNYLENLGKSKAKEAKRKPMSKQEQKRQKRQLKADLEEKTIEYEFDVDPASLVNRIMSVREHISKEWVQDLETLIRSNEQILNSYLDSQLEARDDEEDDEEVKDLTAPYSDRSSKKDILYDRSAMTLLDNSVGSEGRGSSPFRKSNFDLLLLLSTQESIHRVLREYREENERIDNFEFLLEFYTDRLEDHFDGHLNYGQADEFLGELLSTPPMVLKTRDGEVHLIDPMGMVEDILRTRSDVAREWKRVVSHTPEDHTDLRRLLLTRRMMEVTEETLATSSSVEKTSESFGSFE